MVTMIEIIRTNAKIANGISVIWSILSAGARRSMRGGDGKRRRGECQGGGRIFEARSRSRLVRHDLRPRSEEHTSELQSLMRNSYAVFCLKKQKYSKKHTDIKHTNRH